MLPIAGPVDTKQVLARKLEGLGARIAARLGKEVTHVVFQRQRNADRQEQQAEDWELRSLFERSAKVAILHLFNPMRQTSRRSAEICASWCEGCVGAT